MTITFYECGCWMIETKERSSYTELMKFLNRLGLLYLRSRHREIIDSHLCVKHELEQKEKTMNEWEERMSKH
jgi:hypothetical protein